VVGRALRTVARGGAAETLPAFELDSHIFYLFTQIFGRRNQQLSKQLTPLGITVPQWRILAVLHERPGCTMNELAEVTTVDRTTLTRALDRMVASGLAERHDDPQDRRSVRLWLTAPGKDMFRRVLPRVVQQNERAVRGFSAAELATFRAQLHRMVRNLDPHYDKRNAAWLTGRGAANAQNRRNKGDI
jgi:MarR family transcriptional regulator, lower aerobic nicotinate degradation pathway regulator